MSVEEPVTELEAAQALTPEEESTLRKAILESGWDQGCFLTDDEAGLAVAPREWIEGCADRSKSEDIGDGADPHPHGLPHADPSADEGWIVITQRCDLLRELRREPLVELARCRLVKGDPLGEAGKNSPRFLLVHRDGKKGWIADLRERIFVPKTRIRDWPPPKQALTDDAGSRADFAMRLGRRYSRKPLPTRYVETVQRPLKEIIEADFVSETAPFTDWLLLDRPGDMPQLIVLIHDDANFNAAEDTAHKILSALEEKFAEHAGTEIIVRRRSEIYLAEFLDAYPVDLYEITQTALVKAKKAEALGEDPPGGAGHSKPSV